MRPKNKNGKTITTFDEHLENRYGKIGTKKRTEFEIKARSFAIAEIIKGKMKSLNILIFLLSLGFSSAAQFNQHQRKIEPLPVDTLTQPPVSYIESSAQFEGGMGMFYKYVGKKLRYPRDAKKLGVEGRVYVSFVVDKDGSIPYNSVKIAKGLFESCDEEALRIIRSSPNWIPGRLAATHEPVAQSILVPIIFKR